MKLNFYGSRTAELFSKELEASLNGVIDHMMITDENNPMCGFTAVSLPGFCWEHTMWSRDAGTFLRELVLWGRTAEARKLCRALIRMVDVNEQGYRMYPELFHEGEKKAGSELDGTCAILIGMCMLCSCLGEDDPLRGEIIAFLLSDSSPLGFILAQLERDRLLAGSGEFGGGCGIGGEYINVVQNNLSRVCLLAAAETLEEINAALAASCRQAAEKLERAIRVELIGEDGVLLWCLDPITRQYDEAIALAPVNRGCGLLNGVMTMTADVCGFCPEDRDGWGLYDAMVNTFEKLYAYPPRRELFEACGCWSQFNEFIPHYSGPSYGQGYALQAMLISDRMEMAEKALDFLAGATYEPVYDYGLVRSSPYYFYERFYTPQGVAEGAVPDAGCGALNLVCVAEPLKAARLMAGFDFRPGRWRLVPRLPNNVEGYEALDVPFPVGDGVIYGDILCQRCGDKLHVRVKMKDAPLDKLSIIFGGRRLTEERIENLEFWL